MLELDGHINPGIAIAKEIMNKEPDSEVIFVGAEIGLENKLVPNAGFKLVHVRAGRFHRKFTFQNVINMRKAILGIRDSKRLIKDFKPDVVIGTGGFICVPIMKAAKSLKVPYIIHESNAFPGLSVRVLARNAAKVLVGFDEARTRLDKDTNVVFTGTPTKFNMDGILNLDKQACKEELKLGKDIDNKKIIFVTGGSQGAKKFNQVVINMVEKYKSEEFFVVVATGIKNYEETLAETEGKQLDKYLKIVDYVYEMDKMYKASDLLITRAGALTVTEISIVRRPSILIPLPYAAENHQLYNAQVLEKIGAGIVIEENSLNADVLYDKIINMVLDGNKLKEMGENAAKLYKPGVEEKIYNEIKDVIRGK